MATADATSFDAMLKEFYTDENIADMCYPEHAFFALCPKKVVGGKRYDQPVQYGRNQGRSRTFSTAQANQGSNNYEDFFVTYQDDYGVVSITRKLLLQSKGAGRNAFAEAKMREVNGMLENLTASCARSMYRGTGGSIGQINSSYTTGTSFTLADPEEVTNFEVDQVLEFSANDGDTASDTLVSGTATVTAINRDAGTVTVSSATPLAASRYVFVEGDFQNSMAGLSAWCPATAPAASDSFLGVDRSVDTRLSGSRVSATTVSITNAIEQGIARMGREGATPDLCLMNHAYFRDLKLELDNKVRIMEMKATTNVSFDAIEFVGARRKIAVLADQNCQDDTVWLVNKSALKLVSLENVPSLVKEDGTMMLRQATASGFEIRGEYYANLAVSDTRQICRVTVG